MIVRKLRLERGWTQEQLAAAAGVSVRTVQRIERGLPASVETRKCLASALQVDWRDLQPEVRNMRTRETDMTDEAPRPGTHGHDDALRLDPLEAEVMEHVRDLKAFYSHLVIYLAVNSLLVLVNLVNWGGYFWAVWPALGWGIGLLVHAAGVFEIIPFFGPEWERRRIARELARRRGARGRGDEEA